MSVGLSGKRFTVSRSNIGAPVAKLQCSRQCGDRTVDFAGDETKASQVKPHFRVVGGFGGPAFGRLQARARLGDNAAGGRGDGRAFGERLVGQARRAEVDIEGDADQG